MLEVETHCMRLSAAGINAVKRNSASKVNIGETHAMRLYTWGKFAALTGHSISQ